MEAAAILFSIAAFGGIAMFALNGRGRPLPPLALALPHGIVVIAAAVALAASLKGHTVPTVTLVALAGFVIAAILGTVHFVFFHLRKRSLSLPLMYIHAAVAAISFMMFLISIFSV